MNLPILIAALAIVALAIVQIRYTRLARRHDEAKRTLNRVAGERDKARWELSQR